MKRRIHQILKISTIIFEKALDKIILKNHDCSYSWQNIFLLLKARKPLRKYIVKKNSPKGRQQVLKNYLKKI